MEREEYGVIEENTKTQTVKCSSCGSNMVFDPESQQLYCEHCGSRKELQEVVSAIEKRLIDGFMEDSNWESDKTVVFSCSNCGAKVVLPAGSTALSCAFCGTAHVQKTEELAGLKPNAVVPFAIGKDDALLRSKTWAKKKAYAPRKFKKNLAINSINGIYTPCFTFDSVTTSYYNGVVGKRHTRVVGSGKNRRTETYIVWRNISGVYNDAFDDVLISAGSKVSQNQIDKLSPFNTGSSKQYEEEYLLGFMAYKHDYDVKSCWQCAKNTIDSAIKSRILKQYNYDVLKYINISTTHEAVTFKYVMLPAYVGNFTYKKKLYNYYVNGETGKVIGKTPVSPTKVIATVLSALAVVAGIALLILL